jgi:hypothetical protein
MRCVLCSSDFLFSFLHGFSFKLKQIRHSFFEISGRSSLVREGNVWAESAFDYVRVRVKVLLLKLLLVSLYLQKSVLLPAKEPSFDGLQRDAPEPHIIEMLSHFDVFFVHQVLVFPKVLLCKLLVDPPEV